MQCFRYGFDLCEEVEIGIGGVDVEAGGSSCVEVEKLPGLRVPGAFKEVLGFGPGAR